MVGKKRKHILHVFTLIGVVISVMLLALAIIILKNSSFNKTIPDVTQIPPDVQKSIANVKPVKQFYVPILLYHYVEYVKDPGDTIRKSLNIIPAVFDAEVKTLKDAGYTFLTPKDLADVLDDKNNLPERSVILSFDDGYRDFYTDVFPILKKYNVKAIAYIVPNFLNKPNNMDVWQLKEIVKSGLVEIGAHTMNHSYLAGLPKKRVEYEVVESKKYLEKVLGIQIVSFAYPYGAFDNQAVDIVKNAGFRTAVTTIHGNLVMDTNRYFIYRLRPGARVGKSLIKLVEEKSFPKLGSPNVY